MVLIEKLMKCCEAERMTVKFMHFHIPTDFSVFKFVVVEKLNELICSVYVNLRWKHRRLFKSNWQLIRLMQWTLIDRSVDRFGSARKRSRWMWHSKKRKSSSELTNSKPIETEKKSLHFSIFQTLIYQIIYAICLVVQFQRLGFYAIDIHYRSLIN